MYALLIAIVLADDWATDVEIADKYAMQAEKFRAFEIEFEEQTIEALRPQIRQARIDRTSNLRQLTVSMQRASERLKGLKDKSIRPNPPLARLVPGFGGWIGAIPWDGAKVAKIVDDSNCVIRWEEREIDRPAIITHIWVTRVPTAKLKEHAAFDVASQPFFVVGEKTWNGERISVIVPIK